MLGALAFLAFAPPFLPLTFLDPLMSKYAIDQLRTAIRELKTPTPLADQLPLPADQASTRDQWLRWLDEYLGAGYYNRQTSVDDGRNVYYSIANTAARIV